MATVADTAEAVLAPPAELVLRGLVALSTHCCIVVVYVVVVVAIGICKRLKYSLKSGALSVCSGDTCGNASEPGWHK